MLANTPEQGPTTTAKVVIYPGSTPVGNATLVVANVLTCNKHSPKRRGNIARDPNEVYKKCAFYVVYYGTYPVELVAGEP
jgi:hypothetical protein